MKIIDFFQNIFEEKRELRRTIASLESIIESKVEIIDELKRQVGEAREALSKKYEVWSDEAAIDFEGLKVVSVERFFREDANAPHTIVGYWGVDNNGNPKLKEWNLWISPEDHAKIVADFRAYLRKKGANE